MEDIENQFGSWPLQAVQFANSLKMKGYDYHFRLGEAAHNSSQAALDLPGIARLAVARLRSREDRAGVRAGSGGEGEAALPDQSR